MRTVLVGVIGFLLGACTAGMRDPVPLIPLPWLHNPVSLGFKDGVAELAYLSSEVEFNSQPGHTLSERPWDFRTIRLGNLFQAERSTVDLWCDYGSQSERQRARDDGATDAAGGGDSDSDESAVILAEDQIPSPAETAAYRPDSGESDEPRAIDEDLTAAASQGTVATDDSLDGEPASLQPDSDDSGTKIATHSAVAVRLAIGPVLLALIAIAIALGAVRLRNTIRDRYRAQRNLCRGCGYDLRGSASTKCSECGALVLRTAAPRIPTRGSIGFGLVALCAWLVTASWVTITIPLSLNGAALWLYWMM